MGERWGLLAALAILLVALPFASAHKNPIVEYAYVGHIWEEAYTTAPRQPVVGDVVAFSAHVEHPGGDIPGNVTALISVYEDDTTYGWYGGEPYRSPDWLLLNETWMRPTGEPRSFNSSVVIDRAGSYRVFVDWYDDGQYMGQSMHALDIEQRTVGPLFLVFSAVAIAGVLIGVRMGVL